MGIRRYLGDGCFDDSDFFTSLIRSNNVTDKSSSSDNCDPQYVKPPQILYSIKPPQILFAAAGGGFVGGLLGALVCVLLQRCT
jgi:hypothetical protein